MVEQSISRPVSGPVLAALLRDIHPDLKLCGRPKDALLHVSDELLAFIRALLKEECPSAVEASTDQWSELPSVLAPHFILPLLYWRMSSLPPKFHPPAPVVHQMRMAFLGNRVRVIHMERQLEEILGAFEDEGVRVLVVRGPALAWSVYPDPALRPSGDLDLLVLPEHMVKARGVLERLGYACTSRRFEAVGDFFREEVFIPGENAGYKVQIDLHWGLWELHPLLLPHGHGRMETFFHRATEVKASSLRFKTLHPVDALIYGSIHLAMIHSRDMRLIWIYDMVLLARRLHCPQDWEILQERSVSWMGRLALERSLKLAQIWCGLQLPDGFNDFNGWPRPTSEELAIGFRRDHVHWARLLLKHGLSRPHGLTGVVRSLFHLLFPPPAMVRLCYPPFRDGLPALSYVRRWHRWFRELIVKSFASSGGHP